MPRSKAAARTLLLAGAAALLPLSGCNGKGPVETVRTEARSPDGAYAAYIVMRSELTPQKQRLQREFLLVLPTNQLPLNRPDLARIAPFAATGLYGLQLEWPSAQQLRVICDDCGLPSGTILRETNHAGSVQIDYQGFSKGEAAHG